MSDEKVKYETFQNPKGVHDVLPKDHEYQTYVKKVVRHRARQAGFKSYVDTKVVIGHEKSVIL